jgi:sugar-specific transcriptional regulator TrmB
MVIDLLQQVGLNKYEAEAYAALLLHGPLTGYELGKRSGVPLSRSYEILERLTVKGLALVQPGDPPRYAAEAPEQFLDRTRTSTTATLDALASALAKLGQSALPEGFWVVRGHAPILAQAKTLIGQAQHTLAVSSGLTRSPSLEQALAQARGRSCRVVQLSPETRGEAAATALLVVDEREGMVGTLTPADRCQAVISTNPGFVAALVYCCAPRLTLNSAYSPDSAQTSRAAQPLEWLDWEERKQRRLLSAQSENRIA